MQTAGDHNLETKKATPSTILHDDEEKCEQNRSDNIKWQSCKFIKIRQDIICMLSYVSHWVPVIYLLVC